MRYHHSDEKAQPNKQLRRVFQGQPCHPCKRLTFWFHWGQHIIDIRAIRRHFGQPVETDADIQHTPAVLFPARMAELKRLVGKLPMLDVIRLAERR